jgi:hypothetical protein
VVAGPARTEVAKQLSDGLLQLGERDRARVAALQPAEHPQQQQRLVRGTLAVSAPTTQPLHPGQPLFLHARILACPTS